MEIRLPKIKKMEAHKKRLRNALLLAHENRRTVRAFGNLAGDFIGTMSKLQKSLAFVAFAIVGLVLAAGIFGPSASSVARAEAEGVINRAFMRIVNLSSEERAVLEEKFQERMQFKGEAGRRFMGMKELSQEEIESIHEQRITSLSEALIEARNAPNLRVVSAEEMPVPGFFGRAGRTFGFRMMKHEEVCDRLSENVCAHFEERAELHEQIKPVSFLIYTNSEGQKVTLGLNANDEPVIKFVEPSDFPAQFGERNLSPHFSGDKPNGRRMMLFERPEKSR